MRNRIGAALLVALTGAIVATADSPTPDQRAASIAPFIDEQTLVVIRIDLEAINVDAVTAKFVKIVEAVIPPSEMQKEAFQKTSEAWAKSAADWVADFTKAGGRDLYIIFSLADASKRTVFAIAPLRAGADAEAIRNLFATGTAKAPASRPGRRFLSPAGVTAKMGGAVYGGSEATLERLHELGPADRPELSKAFAAAGDAAVQILILPTDDTRRVIEEMMPQLPPQIGGGPSTALTRGLMWAAIGLDLPPKMSLKLTIQSQDEASARALRDLVDRALKAVGELKQVKTSVPNFERLRALLTPTPANDQLRLALDAKQMDHLIFELLTPALRRARQLARRVASAINLRQITTAILGYATEHDHDWPPNLQVLVEAKLISERRLVNPAAPQRSPGYAYVRPADKWSTMDNPGTVILVHEAYEKWGEGINVGFADSHTEFVANEQEFLKALKRSRQAKPKGN